MVSVACYQHTLTHTQPLSKAGVTSLGSHQILWSQTLPVPDPQFLPPSLPEALGHPLQAQPHWKPEAWDPFQTHPLGADLTIPTAGLSLPWSLDPWLILGAQGLGAQQSDSCLGWGLVCPPQHKTCPKACD